MGFPSHDTGSKALGFPGSGPVALVTNAVTTASDQLHFAATTGVSNGMRIINTTGVPNGARVLKVTGTAVFLDRNATVASGATVNFVVETNPTRALTDYPLV